jgi:hypothetical protein
MPLPASVLELRIGPPIMTIVCTYLATAIAPKAQETAQP